MKLRSGLTVVFFSFSFCLCLRVVQLLVDHHAEVSAVAANPSQVQPLHSAAAGRATKAMRILLDAGADPNAKQMGGWTALQSAAKQGDLEMVELLVAHGADCSQPADDGETAVTMARDDDVRARLAEWKAKRQTDEP